MPVPDYKTYLRMLENAKKNKFAYPSINVTSMQTASAAMQAFANKKSDGIIQVSIGGGKFASGAGVNKSAKGAIAIAEYVHRMADEYDVYIAVHSDHCQPEHVEDFLKPLIQETARRRKKGLSNLFNSHMFDGSSIPLKENIKIAKKLLKLCKHNDLILEVEAGVVGGEEDGVRAKKDQKLYTTPQDMVYVYEQLKPIGGKFTLAATFGNVHGVYKPGNVKLNPEILREGQQAIVAKHGEKSRFYLVFHGGSGSEVRDIKKAVKYGVVKMNVDTDTQYAFTHPIVDHIMKHYDAVLKVDGNVGKKKYYDPRNYLKKAQRGETKRVERQINILGCAGKTLYRGKKNNSK